MSLMTRRIDLGAADRNVRRPRCFDLEIFGRNKTTSIIECGLRSAALRPPRFAVLLRSRTSRDFVSRRSAYTPHPASLRPACTVLLRFLLRSRASRHFLCRRSPQCCSPLCSRSVGSTRLSMTFFPKPPRTDSWRTREQVTIHARNGK